MHFIAGRALAGDVPYRDLWDMNGPAIYQIHMLLALAPWDDIRVLQVFAIVVFATAMFAGWRLASGLGRAPVTGALMMGLYALWLSQHVMHVMGQRDVIIATLAVVALWLMLEDREKQWRWAAAGLLLGYAVGIKPVAAPFALAAFAASLAMPGDPRLRLSRALALTAGGVAGGLVWITWLAMIGALDDWWAIMTTFNGSIYLNIARMPLHVLLMSPTTLLAIVAATAVLAAQMMTRPDEVGGRFRRSDLFLVLAFLAGGLISFLGQGKGWPYQMAPVWLLGLTALGAALSQWAGGRVPALIAAVFVALVAVLTLPDLLKLHAPDHRELVSARVRHVASMHAALDTLPADMKVQALDTTDGALQAMLETGRASASPVLYDFWLFEGSRDSQERARKALLDGLGTAPSAVLVTNQGWPNAQRTGFERLSDFPELDGLLHDHYKLVAEGTHGWGGERLRFRLYRPAG
jgi:hypothetical protein